MLRYEADNKEEIEQLAAEKDLSGKQLWNRVKRMAGWSVSLSPNKFTPENGLITDPIEMANSLNNFFTSKIEEKL